MTPEQQTKLQTTLELDMVTNWKDWRDSDAITFIRQGRRSRCSGRFHRHTALDRLDAGRSQDILSIRKGLGACGPVPRIREVTTLAANYRSYQQHIGTAHHHNRRSIVSVRSTKTRSLGHTAGKSVPIVPKASHELEGGIEGRDPDILLVAKCAIGNHLAGFDRARNWGYWYSARFHTNSAIKSIDALSTRFRPNHKTRLEVCSVNR